MIVQSTFVTQRTVRITAELATSLGSSRVELVGGLTQQECKHTRVPCIRTDIGLIAQAYRIQAYGVRGPATIYRIPL